MTSLKAWASVLWDLVLRRQIIRFVISFPNKRDRGMEQNVLHNLYSKSLFRNDYIICMRLGHFLSESWKGVNLLQITQLSDDITLLCTKMHLVCDWVRTRSSVVKCEL